jgi:hypothetical protein
MNEIAKLLEACDRFWVDVKNLFNDITNIMLNDSGICMTEYLKYQDFRDGSRNYTIFYKKKSLLYIIFDSKADIPFIQIYCFNKLNKDKDLNELFLKKGKYKNWDPLLLIEEEGCKTEKISDYFFSILNQYGECFVSEKIDIMSIDSSDIVNTEIKNLIEVFINGKFKQYETKKLKFLID